MSLLIKNIQLIDGSGRPAVKSDVLVKNQKIAATGYFPRYRADEIIDGKDAYLSPGFIDIHNNSDHFLTIFSDPEQTDFLTQGITTIVSGNCGASLAPLLYGSLESFKEWTDIHRVNVNWHTMAEFFKTMSQRPLGINFSTLIGHTTIRQALSGDAFRELTKNEMAVFELLLERALKEGALGFSAGLGYALANETPYSELKFFLRALHKYRALFAVHLRDEKGRLLPSVKEIINLSKETGVKTIISHFRPLIGNEMEYDTCLNLISEEIHQSDVYFDIAPFDESRIAAYMLLPSWARKENIEKILTNLMDNDIRKKIAAELPRMKGERITIVYFPGNEYLKGKTLKEFSQNRGLKSIKEALFRLIEISKGRASILCKNMNLGSVMKALTHERAIIASHVSGQIKSSVILPQLLQQSSPPEEQKFNKAFIKTLELVEKEKIMPIETAIHKMTGLPAAVLRLKNRGLIRENYFADFVLFKGAEIQEVILNGKRIVKEGRFQNILAGQIVKREA